MANKINSENIERLIRCSRCGGKLAVKAKRVVCKKCDQNFPLIEGNIPDMTVDVTPETEISLRKWDRLYGSKKYLKDLERDYKRYFLDNTIEQLNEFIPKKTEREVFLEIGSGSAFVGEEFAKRGWFFIGIDFSLSALKYLKKRFEEHGIKNYLLVRGDIQNMPINDSVVDVIYGGGVIEHFKNTQVVIDHLHRILKRGGMTFNSVPVFNIGNLVYRSKWGGIPNIPILKQLAELIHIRILKGKHMIFGYELQFTQNQLKRLHEKSGFKSNKISITNFRCIVQLNGIKNKFIRDLFIRLCNNNRNFWPGVKVVAYK